ncbi:MAG: hypothetical protein KDA58_14510 [Planctomycetaceae bacterium]|nr:hypothetical protein [Planctomycetaceae bacterium]
MRLSVARQILSWRQTASTRPPIKRDSSRLSKSGGPGSARTQPGQTHWTMNEPNPFLTPRPRGTRLLQGTLRVAVAAQCWGQAAAMLHLHQLTPVAQLMEQAYGLSSAEAAMGHQFVAYAMLISGLCTLLRPCWPVLLPLVIWQGLVAASTALYGQGLAASFEPAMHAPRILAPLALMLVDMWPPKIRTTLPLTRAATGLLQLGTLALLTAHGIVTLIESQHPGEIAALVRQCAVKLGRESFSDEHLRSVLLGIGVMEVACVVSLMGTRVPLAALWVTLWGLVLASAHTFAWGPNGFPQTLTESANWGAPLGLLIFWSLAMRPGKDQFVPEPEDIDEGK